MRTRIRHLEYGWLGDLDSEATAGNSLWAACRWDSGECTREHIADIEILSNAESHGRRKADASQ